MPKKTWAFVTGEYPPQPGGVSDYTWVLAHALKAAGDDVHVFAPPCALPEISSDVIVHRIYGGFSLLGLVRLGRELAKIPNPRRVVLQYVVQSFGMRAMNVFFAIWIGRLRGYPLWVMVHEFAIMDSREISLVRRIQAWITRRIARSVMKAADRIFYATPQWKDAIVRAAPSVPSRHLPVPSNVLMEKNTALIERMRTRLCGERYRHVVGHFGSYRMPELFEFLRSFTRKIIEKDADCIVLFLGRGSDEFVADSISLEPSLKDRTFATGAVDPATLSNYLCSCDVLVQPYRHGVATNRSSVMAGLALGIPIVTTKGINTESIWSGCVSLVPFEIEATVKESIDLLRDEGRRQMLSTHSLDLYKTNFDVRCSIEIIQNPDEPRSI